MVQKVSLPLSVLLCSLRSRSRNILYLNKEKRKISLLVVHCVDPNITLVSEPTLSVDRDGKYRFGHESKNQKTAKANRRKEKKSRNPNPNPKGKRVAGPYLGPTAGSTAAHRLRGSPTEGRLAGTQLRAAARGLGTPSPRAGSDRAPPPSRSTAACSHTGEHVRRREGRRRRRNYLPRRPPRGCRLFSWREKTGRERMKLGFGGQSALAGFDPP